MKTFNEFMNEGKFAVISKGRLRMGGKSKDNPEIDWVLNTITGELMPLHQSDADKNGHMNVNVKDFLKEPGVVFSSKKEIEDEKKTNKSLAATWKKGKIRIGKI